MIVQQPIIQKHSTHLKTIHHRSPGKHILFDLYECNHEMLNNRERIEEALLDLTRIFKLTVIESMFHRLKPYGISGVIVIAESHIAIHTWPEYGYAAIDFFTCRDQISENLLNSELSKRFEAQRTNIQNINRGSQLNTDEFTL